MIFSEKQYVANWVRILFVLLIVLMAFGAFNNYKNVPLVILLLSLLVAFSVLLFSRLSVVIDSDKISVRFFPFHMKPVVYPIKNIAQITLVQYDPISTFGGWGIRFNLKKEKIFSVSGNHALFIVTSGKNRYIGINDTAAAHAFLMKTFPDIYDGRGTR
jgi:hypothetical protein